MDYRTALQVITLTTSLVTLSLILYRIRNRQGDWRVWLPLVINLIFTIVFYIAVLLLPGIGFLGDLSAALRLETVITFLLYAFYMPRGMRLK